jgi:hypothetical protein
VFLCQVLLLEMEVMYMSLKRVLGGGGFVSSALLNQSSQIRLKRDK